jgi:Xaa-Pro aminopeptidase
MKQANQTQRKKSSEAIESILHVQRVTEVAMEAVILYLKSAQSPTSEESHQIINSVLGEHNCESPKGHIVASGQQSAEPHEFGHGPIFENVSIVIDIYPRSKETGYFADMTRTVCLGKPPLELQKMYDTVLQAQELALSMVKPDAVCTDIQKTVEQFFISEEYATSGKGKEFAFAEGFVHSIGHGVGLYIHESPHFGRKSLDLLKEGDVITIEPGLYYKNIGGVRLEDMVLVTADGFQNLTNFPKKLQLI